MTYLTDDRKELFDRILSKRTRWVTVVLEDIFQSHNASAVLRTCDCFGIQDVHIIENRNEYELNPDVSVGSSKWLTMHKYSDHDHNTKACLQGLRDNGYRLVATVPDPDATPLDQLDLSSPLAFMFGTELDGLTETSLELADERITIPMHGFTQSFNISVSAALCLHQTTQRLRQTELPYGLSNEEKQELLLQWTRNTIKKPELLEKEFLARTNQ